MKSFEYSEFYKEWKEISDSISDRYKEKFLNSWLTPVNEDEFISMMIICKDFHHSVIHRLESKTDFRFDPIDFLNIFKQYSFNKSIEMEFGFHPDGVLPSLPSLMMVAIAYANHADRVSAGGIHSVYPSIANTANELITMLYSIMDKRLEINLRNKGMIMRYNRDNDKWVILCPNQ